MYTLDTRALRAAQERFVEEIAVISKDALALPAHDYASYMRRVGEYHALNRALQILQEVESKLK